MSRYFFNIYDGFAHPDRVGTELPSVAAAQRDAITMAADLLAPESAMIWSGEEWHIEVTDTAADVVFTIRFSARLRVPAHR